MLDAEFNYNIAMGIPNASTKFMKQIISFRSALGGVSKIGKYSKIPIELRDERTVSIIANT